MLKTKTAVITGGSRGIGAAIALKMAEQGADVAIIYAGNTEKATEVRTKAAEFGVKAEIYRCDVADFAAVKETVSRIVADFGTIDILVNNAGITRDSLIFSMSEDNWDAVMNINLKGTFNMIKHISPLFLRKRGGKIINISSVAGLFGNAGQANYSASKAGIIGLTKTIARELAAKGICCNAVAPGIIDTEMTENLPGRENLVASVPAKRAGTTANVADTVLFLASSMSDYVTGEVIRVDGGLAM